MNTVTLEAIAIILTIIIFIWDEIRVRKAKRKSRELEKKLNQCDLDYEKATERYNEANDQLQIKIGEVGRLNNDISLLKEQAGEFGKKVETLDTVNRRLINLQEELDKSKNTVKDKDVIIKQKDEEISKLTEQLSGKSTEISTLQRTNALEVGKLNTRIHNLERQMAYATTGTKPAPLETSDEQPTDLS